MKNENAEWSVKDKLCFITGATSGIGKITAVELAKRGAKVIYTARNLEKAKVVKSEIVSESQNDSVEFFECDLSSFESIKRFSDDFIKKYPVLHVLINNAGLWNPRRKLSKDNIEITFAVNYLAPFLLTNLLLDLLKKSAPSRIINVSGLHSIGKFDLNDLESKRHYNGMQTYSNSKREIILFTKALARKLENSGVTANIAQPGMVRTGLYRDLPLIAKKFIFLFGAVSPDEGAKTTIYLATSNEVSNISGEYFEKEKITSSSDKFNNKEEAEKLWEISTTYIKKYLF